MKSLLVALSVCLVLAAIPSSTAEAACANDPPRDQAAVLPLGEGTYLSLTTSTPTKIGLWTESNWQRDLQVQACLEDAEDPSTAWYEADTQLVPLA